MKCDELFVYCKTTCDPQGLYYSKPEVDEAIAELKVRNVMFHDEAKYYKAENESLKSKLESVQASAYADSVDAGMRERRLRRALWLARAKRAKEMAKGYNAVVEWCSHSRWIEVERKCIEKAGFYL